MNVGLYMAGTKRARGGPLVIDQATVVDAMNLLNRSGAFTWHSRDEAGLTSVATALRIHCPAQAFLHKLLANHATLTPLVRFVESERRRAPVAPDLAASLDFVREAAAREERGILEHGARWSELKLAQDRSRTGATSAAHSDSR
jgi:hypothetical protein